MFKIFLCEDDEDLAFDISSALSKDGNCVERADCANDARRELANKSFDIVILDWELPDGSGIDILKEYRSAGGVAAVIMLTGKSLSSEKELGLDSGADDYLCKPFSLQELRARLRALSRRKDRPLTENILKCRELELDSSRFYACLKGKTLQLVPKEFALLEFFMRNKDLVFSTDDLISHVWTADEEVSPDTLRTHIMNLRRKLNREETESYIETVHGLGYRFKGIS